MTTIYVVTQGEYSDYNIMGMYSTPEKAKYAVQLYGDDSVIEEYELDALPPHPPGELNWQVTIMENGDVVSAFQMMPALDYRPIVSWFSKYWGGEEKPNRIFQLWAPDKDHAIKIVTEKRREMLAMGTWNEEKVG